MRSTVSIVLSGVMLALSSVPAVAAEPAATPVFTAKSDEGQAWVSVDLARFRRNEPYIPLVVAVYNRSSDTAVLTRGSFALVDHRGRRLAMPGVAEIRKGYDKLNLDQTMVRVFGFPTGTLLTLSRLVPSNFFPPVTSTGGVVIEKVELPRFTWTIDLLYFPRPEGLEEGYPAKLVVAPEGWDHPLDVTIRL